MRQQNPRSLANLKKGGNHGNAGGGRPSNDFRKRSREKLDDWLTRASDLLTELDAEATEFEQKLKLIEAAGKLAERFGKYTGLEKSELISTGTPAVTIDFGAMSVEDRKRMLAGLGGDADLPL